MITKRIVLRFPKEMVDRAVVWRLAKDFNLEFNILKAEVSPAEEGILVLELKGKDDDYQRGVDYLKKSGVKIQLLSEDIVLDHQRCVDCGLCVALCPTQALRYDSESLQVEFFQEKCLACGICIGVCPYKAITISF